MNGNNTSEKHIKWSSEGAALHALHPCNGVYLPCSKGVYVLPIGLHILKIF